MLETKVVARGAPFISTCAPETKLAPVTVRVYAPKFVTAGVMPVMVGVGFRTVTALVEFFVESAALTAVTVIVFGEGSAAGAVYAPVVSMVPRAEEPPAALFTDQVTELLLVPVTVAEKVREAPARIFAVAGATVTATTAAGAVGIFGEVEEEPDEHAVRRNAGTRARTARWGQIRAERACIYV